MKPECNHQNRAYSPTGMTLTCIPPINISYWICKECGFEGEDRQQDSLSTEYSMTKAKFHNSGNTGNITTNAL